jgi:hypothetical protein
VSAKLQQVHIRVNDAATGKPTPCRVRFTDGEGNYYAPHGRSTRFPADYDLDHEIGGNLYVGKKPHAYIDGSCEIGLPPGLVHVTITKGPEYETIDKSISLPPGKLALRFELKRLIDPARERWHAGAIAVSTMSPHDVLLEGAAEGLHVVDLLAYERETTTVVDYPNLIAFSGQRACLETSECLVAVNTLNGHFVLGGLALLNCHRPIFPFRFGCSRSGEPAPDDWSLAAWCDQCHRKRGLVIGLNVAWWEKSNGGEGLADTILGKIDAVGLGELFVGSIKWWYTLLSLGLRAPVVAGIPTRPLGQISRTYARLQSGQECTYAHWIEAVRAGRTVVADGPFLTMIINGEDPGASIDLGGAGAVVKVRAEVMSREDFHQLEIVRDGTVVMTQASRRDGLFHAEIDTELPVEHSGWLAARCTDKPYPDFQQVHAHTSPVYLRIDHRPPPVDPEAVRTVTELLDRTLKWVERDALCETPKDRERLANVFREAKQVLLRKLEH